MYVVVYCGVGFVGFPLTLFPDIVLLFPVLGHTESASAGSQDPVRIARLESPIHGENNADVFTISDGIRLRKRGNCAQFR